MFLFITLDKSYIIIYNIATYGAKADWSVWATMIEVEALFSLHYHFSISFEIDRR